MLQRHGIPFRWQRHGATTFHESPPPAQGIPQHLPYDAVRVHLGPKSVYMCTQIFISSNPWCTCDLLAKRHKLEFSKF